MTKPRNVRPGVTWMVTHRAVLRHYLFTPDAAGIVEQIYWFTTAYAAQQTGVKVHVVQLMSTHPHEVLTDVRGELPRFFELRNRLLSNALKVLHGWRGEVFDSRQSVWVELVNVEAVIKESAYVEVNCVAAGAVRTPSRWPGAKALAQDMGKRTIRVKCPDVYFRKDNWPKELTLDITIPDLLRAAYGDDATCRAVVQAEVDRQAQSARRKNKRGFLGKRRVLKQPHTKRATSREPLRQMNPTFSTAGDQKAAKEVHRRNIAFHRAYRKAWARWQRGNRDVAFPSGTWKMRWLHNANAVDPA